MRIMTLSWLGSYGASLDGISKMAGTCLKLRMNVMTTVANRRGKIVSYSGETHSGSVRINEMPDMLRHTLCNEQNRNVFSDLSKIKESLFNLFLIGCSLVTNVKVCALATGALPDSCRRCISAELKNHGAKVQYMK